MENPQPTLFSMVKNKVKVKSLSHVRLFSSYISNKIRMLTLTTVIQYNFGTHNHSNQWRKRNKRKTDYNRRIKTLFANDMILYIENPKDAMRKSLVLMNEFSKVTGYKIHSNHLHSYMLTMENQKKKLRKYSHSPFQQKE